MDLVLGSSSKFRADILKQAGYDFEVIEPLVDEKLIRSSKPEVMVCLLAMAKAMSVANNFANKHSCVILTSDQVIVSDGLVFEKPLKESGEQDEDMVLWHFKSYEKHPAEAYTSVCVFDLDTERCYVEYDITKVYIRKLTNSQLGVVMADDWTYKAAGSLPTGIPESPASQVIQSQIEWIEGDEDGFRGLPLPLTMELLNRIGYRRSVKA